jgi:hypothetical protein
MNSGLIGINPEETRTKIVAYDLAAHLIFRRA